MKTKNFKYRILDLSIELFLQRGYTNVGMDEIAKTLGISKKTIYNYYSGKKELLINGIHIILNDLSREVEKILNNKELDFSEKLKQNVNVIAEKLSKITPHFAEDLQINEPDAWEIISEYKKKSAILHIRQLIDEGRAKGKIKKDINSAMAVMIYMTAIDNLLNPAYLKSFPSELLDEIPYKTKDIFDSIVKIIYEGIVESEIKI